MSVRNVIAEPLRINNIGIRAERTQLVAQALERVQLSPDIMPRYPHEFSGGQRQRISLARSMILKPKLVLCDEPVSALDVSVQTQILNLLSKLQKEMELTYLFIAHDLNVVEYVSDRVAVMYLGKIVEIASSDELYQVPQHPYAEALMNSIPVPDPRSSARRIPLEGTVPDPSNPPNGCNFNTRCPYTVENCEEIEPELREVTPDHFVACHRVDELDLRGYEERVQDQENKSVEMQK